MTTLREAAQQALEALEANQYAVASQAPHADVMAYNDAIIALRAALAQQVEPVAPPQRKPLTEEEIYEMYSEPSSDAEMVEFARAIERAHKIGGGDEQV